MPVARHIVVVVSLLALGTAARAQVEITHTYPFTQSRVVVTERVGSNPAVIYEGAGSGVFVLDGTNLEPELKAGVANQLRAGGLIRDLCLTNDYLYAAVHRGGITRFTRGNTSPLPEWTTIDDPDVRDAWTVNVPVQVGDHDLIFVGTNDEYDHNDSKSGGRLCMLSADTGVTPDPPTLITSIPLGAPIFSIASMVQGNVVTLLVGTACRQPTSGTYASLLRYDFDISSGLPTAFPTPATWNPIVSGSTVPTFIRDIVIDPSTSPPVAYVAAYTRGVFKVNVPSGINGGLSTASGSWPIAGSGRRYFDSLALHDGSLGKVLVVGMGRRFATKRPNGVSALTSNPAIPPQALSASASSCIASAVPTHRRSAL